MIAVGLGTERESWVLRDVLRGGSKGYKEYPLAAEVVEWWCTSRRFKFKEPDVVGEIDKVLRMSFESAIIP
jgi:hypothetical protein